MGRSKFRQAPLRVRPKHKGSDDGAAQTPAESFAALGTALFTGIARGLSPLFWVLPVVMAGLFVSAAHERNRCELCHSPSGDCAPITLGVWDARSFKAETLEPFAGRFNGETVFETSGIVCKATGVHCEWNGDFDIRKCNVKRVQMFDTLFIWVLFSWVGLNITFGVFWYMMR